MSDIKAKYKDCVFINYMCPNDYMVGCLALNRRYCLGKNDCNFYKSNKEYENNIITGFAERRKK